MWNYFGVGSHTAHPVDCVHCITTGLPGSGAVVRGTMTGFRGRLRAIPEIKVKAWDEVAHVWAAG